MNTITKEQFIALVQNNEYFDIEEVTEKCEELNEIVEKINEHIENGVTNTFNFKMYELSSIIGKSELSEQEQNNLFNWICEAEWYDFENEILPNEFNLLQFETIGHTSTHYILPKHTIEDRYEFIFTESEKYNLNDEVGYGYRTWENAIYEIASGITEIEDFEYIENRMDYELRGYDEIKADDYHDIVADWKDDLIVNLENELYLLKEVLEVLEQAKRFKEYLDDFKSEEHAKQLFENYNE